MLTEELVVEEESEYVGSIVAVVGLVFLVGIVFEVSEVLVLGDVLVAGAVVVCIGLVEFLGGSGLLTLRHWSGKFFCILQCIQMFNHALIMVSSY